MSKLIKDVPNLANFIKRSSKKYFIQTYGCQMNENDSQIVSSILSNSGYQNTSNEKEADIYLINTCAIRENAEKKVFTRLDQIKKSGKQIVVLGCMAERLKNQFFERGVDVVAGPDTYRRLPELIEQEGNQIDTELSLSETYDDIMPQAEGITRYVSIMRGCNNMCSYCIVPFTRGRERSRDPESILREIEFLEQENVKEITLLGQNVNSYHWQDENYESEHKNSEGFSELYKSRGGKGVRFPQLLEIIAKRFSGIRIRFTSPHPKDFPIDTLRVIAEYDNIAKQIHMPVQSGSNEVLKRMRRQYTREAALDLIGRCRKIIPNVGLSSDIIVGFCGETIQEYQDTLTFMELAQFDFAYMFSYSMRKKTHAYHRLEDDVSDENKKERLKQLIDLQYKIQKNINKEQIGKMLKVLVEREGKREGQVMGKSDNKTVFLNGDKSLIGQYCNVKIVESTSISLIGELTQL